MAAMLNPPKLVAVDTNVALDFAKGVEDVCDAIATIQARIAGVELLLPPTVMGELANAAATSADLLTSSDAELAGVDHKKLAVKLDRFDLIAPVIVTPREVVKKFFR
jgi:hypothetical protein